MMATGVIPRARCIPGKASPIRYASRILEKDIRNASRVLSCCCYRYESSSTSSYDRDSVKPVFQIMRDRQRTIVRHYNGRNAIGNSMSRSLSCNYSDHRHGKNGMGFASTSVSSQQEAQKLDRNEDDEIMKPQRGQQQHEQPQRVQQRRNRGNPMSIYVKHSLYDHDHQMQSLQSLLSLDEYPVGSFTPETWFEAEEVLPYFSIQRTPESVVYSFQLLDRLLQEKAIHQQFDEWLDIDTFNQILNNFRVVWWDPIHSRVLSEHGLTPQTLIDRFDINMNSMNINDHYSDHGKENSRVAQYYVLDNNNQTTTRRTDTDSKQSLDRHPAAATIPINEKSLYLVLEAALTNGDRRETSELASRVWSIMTTQLAPADVGTTTRGIDDAGEDEDDTPSIHPSTDLCHLFVKAWLRKGGVEADKKAAGITVEGSRLSASKENAQANPMISPYADDNEDGTFELENTLLNDDRYNSQTLDDDGPDLTPEEYLDVAKSCQRLLMYMLENHIPITTRLVEGVLLAWARVGTVEAALQSQNIWEQIVMVGNTRSENGIEDTDLKPTLRALATVSATWARASNEAPLLASQHAQMLTKQLHSTDNPILPIKSKALYVPAKAVRDYRVALSSAMGCVALVQKTSKLVLEMFDNFRTFDIEPNYSSYLWLIQAYGKLGMYEEAIEALNVVLDRFREYKVRQRENQQNGSHFEPPQPILFTAVLIALSKSNVSNKADKAHDLWRILESTCESYPETGLKPNKYMYNALLDCFASCTAQDDRGPFNAQAVLDQMIQRAEETGDDSLRPNEISFATVMKAWARHGHAHRAKEVLHRMMDLGITPDNHNWNILLSAFSRSKNDQAAVEAEKILKQMKKIHSTGMSKTRPDSYSYTSVISAFATSTRKNRAESARRANALLQELRKDYHDSGGDPSLLPHRSTYNAVMNAFARAYKPERAEGVLQEMYLDYRDRGNENAKPDVSSFNTLLKAWSFVSPSRADACEKAEEIISRMIEWNDSGILKNVAPNMISYTTLMVCYGRSQSQPQAAIRCEEILQTMDSLYKQGKLDQAPSKRTFDTLRKAWSSSSEPNKEERVKAIQKEMAKRFGFAGKKFDS